MSDLFESVAVVTGASRGIGAAIARSLAARGCNVVLAARDGEALERMAAQLSAAYGIRAIAVATDVAREQEVRALIARADELFGRIDILVNNAGMGIYGQMDQIQLEDLRHVFDVNFFAVVTAMQAAAPIMERQGGGTIVNVSSIVGKFPSPLGGGYSATKFALQAVSTAARVELAGDNIHVVTLCPGLTETEFSRHSRVSVPGGEWLEGQTTAAIRGIPAQRVGERTVEAILRKEREVYITWYDRAIVTAASMLPGLFERGLAIVAWLRKQRFARMQREVGRKRPEVRRAEQPTAAPSGAVLNESEGEGESSGVAGALLGWGVALVAGGVALWLQRRSESGTGT